MCQTRERERWPCYKGPPSNLKLRFRLLGGRRWRGEKGARKGVERTWAKVGSSHYHYGRERKTYGWGREEWGSRLRRRGRRLWTPSEGKRQIKGKGGRRARRGGKGDRFLSLQRDESREDGIRV